MRMDQWCIGVGGLSRLRTFITSAEIDIIARRAHGDHQCFRSSGTKIDGRSLQTDSTRIMRDQKEHADTKGEVQMGTKREDGCLRLDEEAWEQCYDVATVLRDGVLSTVDEDRELAMRKVYRETHKRNLRPHQQVEQAQTGEYDRRNVVGCSHMIKSDEASGSDH